MESKPAAEPDRTPDAEWTVRRYMGRQGRSDSRVGLGWAMLWVSLLVGSALAILVQDHASALQQQVTIPLPSGGPPRELVAACKMQRSTLAVEVVASATEYNPDRAERVADGWLIHDRYTRRVVELDDSLQKRAQWGRPGDGPLEYGGVPAGLGKTESGGTYIVDERPPSVLVFDTIAEEYRLQLERPFIDHAVVASGRLLLASNLGIQATQMSRGREVATAWSLDDLGIAVSADGQPPSFLLRKSHTGYLYAGTTTQSAIWQLDGGEGGPRKVVQRCVPRAWQDVHRKAPVFDDGPFKGRGYSLHTLEDFVVLEGGRLLALGALDVNEDRHKSVELYDVGGALVKSWILPLAEAKAVFDPYNPRRILVLGTKGEEPARLIEVDGESYPSS